MNRMDRRFFILLVGAGASALVAGDALGKGTGSAPLDVTFYYLPG